MFQAVVELVAFLVADQPDRHSFQDVSFTALRWLGHGHGVEQGAAEVQSILTPPLPCRYSARSDETAVATCTPAVTEASRGFAIVRIQPAGVFHGGSIGRSSLHICNSPERFLSWACGNLAAADERKDNTFYD